MSERCFDGTGPFTPEIEAYLRALAADPMSDEREDCSVQNMLPFWAKVRPEDLAALFVALDDTRSQLTAAVERAEKAERQATAFVGEVATALAIDARNDGWRVVNVARAAESLAEAAAMFVEESDAATSEFNPTEGEVRAFQMMRERAAAYMKARQ